MKGNKKKQQLSEEELQRTQVLNFDDFKKTARIEKVGSKKPAAIIAMIGLLSILIGVTYPGIKSLISNRKQQPQQVQTRKEETKQEEQKKEDVIESKLNCTKTTNNPDGTIEKITINFVFENEKLQSFEKIYNLTIAPGSINGKTALDNFKTSLPTYIVKKDGYEVTTKEIENGIETTTIVDYKKLNINDLPQANQDNYRYNVTYIKDTLKENLLKDIQSGEFLCV